MHWDQRWLYFFLKKTRAFFSPDLKMPLCNNYIWIFIHVFLTKSLACFVWFYTFNWRLTCLRKKATGFLVTSTHNASIFFLRQVKWVNNKREYFLLFLLFFLPVIKTNPLTERWVTMNAQGLMVMMNSHFPKVRREKNWSFRKEFLIFPFTFS